MAGRRSALIVATYEYADAGLTRLRAPLHDAEALAGVLGHPEIGAFEVEQVVNQPAHEVSAAVARFFRSGRPDDLLLVHFSCHGVKDESGELYFAATNTLLDLLEATAVSSAFVDQVMQRSRAGTVLLLLDCCYAGAFGRGSTHRAGGAVDVGDRLGGSGRAVITASSALEYAFEGTDLADGRPDTTPSVFTSALVKGLTTGEADRDLDGYVSLDELYGYIYDEVTRINPHQTPERRFDVQGDLVVARRGRPVTTPADLPREVEESLASPLPWVRESTVEVLTGLLRGDHPGRALAARQALERMAEGDDSSRNREAARDALAGVPEAHRSVVDLPAIASAPEPDQTAYLPPVPALEEPAAPPVATYEVRSPSGRRRWLVVGAAALVLVLAVGWFTRGLWNGDGGANGSSGTSSGPYLDSDSMVVALYGSGKPALAALVPTTGGTTPLHPGVDAAVTPSISADRTHLAFIEPTGPAGGVVYVAQTDGLKARPLLDSAARSTCPFVQWATWSPRADALALTCRDGDKNFLGLEIVSRSGSIVRNLRSRPPVGPPCWGGDGDIYVSAYDGTRSVIWKMPADGKDKQRSWHSDPDFSYFDPAWSSDHGVAMVRYPVSDGGTEYVVTVDPATDADRRLAEVAAGKYAHAPTWSPSEDAIAWNTTDDVGAKAGQAGTLYVAPVSSDRTTPVMGTRVEPSGSVKVGYPAWGSD